MRVEEEKDGILAADEIFTFDEVPKTVYLRYKNKEQYEAGKEKLEEVLNSEPGNDEVRIYLDLILFICRVFR